MNDRNTIIAGAVLITVLAGVATWMHGRAVWRRWDRIDSLRNELKVLQDSVQRNRHSLREDRLQDQVADRRMALPDDDQVAGVLHDLTQDLNELSVTNRTLRCGETNHLGPVRHIRLNLSFKGSFGTIFELLDRMNSLRRVMRVEQLT